MNLASAKRKRKRPVIQGHDGFTSSEDSAESAIEDKSPEQIELEKKNTEDALFLKTMLEQAQSHRKTQDIIPAKTPRKAKVAPKHTTYYLTADDLVKNMFTDFSLSAVPVLSTPPYGEDDIIGSKMAKVIADVLGEDRATVLPSHPDDLLYLQSRAAFVDVLSRPAEWPIMQDLLKAEASTQAVRLRGRKSFLVASNRSSHPMS